MDYKDYKLKSGNILRVEQDVDAQSPDTWENEDVFLVYEHRDFTIRREGFKAEDIYVHTLKDGREQEKFDDYFIFPVDAYIHSGVHLSLAGSRDYPDRRWGVSTAGFVLVRKFTDEEPEQNLIESKAREYAKGLLETWNQYLSGDVWGYRVLEKNKSYNITEEDLENLIKEDDNNGSTFIYVDEFKEIASLVVDYEEELDSCWGFYTSNPKSNGMLEYINDTILDEED